MLFAISDNVWLALIGLVGLFVKDWLDQRRATAAAEKVQEAAVKTEQVAAKVEDAKKVLAVATTAVSSKLEQIAKTGEGTYALCNHAMQEQKRMHAVKCREGANQDPTPINIAEADLAELVYEEHKARQAKIDAQQDKPSHAP